jgi:uncharacterized protein YecT (DUF1311 family)
MKLFLLIIGFLLSLPCFSQGDKAVVEITPELETKIWNDIERLMPEFKKKLGEQHLNQVQMEFTIDTFKVEKFMEKCIKLNYTDAGMSEGTYAGAHFYDSLLNKWYKKLIAVLKPADKTTLIQAQRAWLSFRDSEIKLVEIISKDEYSGGGTIQRLAESGEYLNMLKGRTIAIFYHYARATQSE